MFPDGKRMDSLDHTRFRMVAASVEVAGRQDVASYAVADAALLFAIVARPPTRAEESVLRRLALVRLLCERPSRDPLHIPLMSSSQQ